MYNYLFVTTLAMLLAPAYIWGFKALPGERWQIICTIPLKKTLNGSWQGLNLTYYGLFNAVALCAAVALVFILAGAAGVDIGILAAILVFLLGCCLPASRLIARWVEKKPHAFSVGAASFLGIVVGPWLVLLMETVARRYLGTAFESMAVFSALMVGYALGEGIGRLACISFGCCYGRPMDGMPKVMQRYFSWAAFTYTGCTKKIAYAHRLEGKKIFAVQGVTAVLYSISALAGTLLYLQGAYAWAYFVCLLVTQAWRFFSEFFRSDYRDDRKITVYQIMSLSTLPYGLLMPFVFPAAGPTSGRPVRAEGPLESGGDPLSPGRVADHVFENRPEPGYRRGDHLPCQRGPDLKADPGGSFLRRTDTGNCPGGYRLFCRLSAADQYSL